jgi:CheY-like chemotaxis protein
MAHKLLLADDSVTIQRVIELTFADEDVEVTTVGDGQLAIERLNSDRFDIVLADIDMPKRDGYEVASYVKSRPMLAHIPVVLLTGAFEPIDQARAQAAGSSDVLAKPFEPQMVINRVKQLLSKKKEDGEYEMAESSPALKAVSNSAPSTTQAAAAPKETDAAAGEPLSLDDYFDQLDAAFSGLQAPAAEKAATRESEIDWPVLDTADLSKLDAPAPALKPEMLDAFVAAAPPAPAPVVAPPVVPPPAPVYEVPPPVAHPVAAAPPPPPPAPVVEPPAPAPAAIVMPAFEPEPASTPDIDMLTPIQEALEAEVAAASVRPSIPPPPAPAPNPPVAPPPPVAKSAHTTTSNPFATLSAAKAEAAAKAATPVITEEVIEEVVSRVLQRMTDRVVRETVAEIVSQTAERLVQEEIERIKSQEQ